MYYFINFKLEMKDSPIVSRIKILKVLFESKITQKRLADKLKIHFNTINNIVKIFKLNNEMWDKDIILNSDKYSLNALIEKFNYLDIKSRKPLSHSRIIEKDSDIWKLIIKFHKETNKGYKLMNNLLKRRLWQDKYNELLITEAKIRWFYKRNKLKLKKVKTSNREYRSPFDFQKDMAFSKLYIDTKHIADKHALPHEIYNKFKYSIDNKWKKIRWLPKYELNIIEQNTRIRFIAYLTELDSNLIMNFVEYVVIFIRWNNFIPHDVQISIWMDWWTEFLSWSEKKIKQYNEHMKYLNTKYYCYNWPKDTRKNLIERSHLSDDLEFYIPRGYSINTKRSFLKEATDYQNYWNFYRIHTWLFMNNLTPIEKAKELWIYNIDIMNIFPTIILQEHYPIISNINKSQNVLTQDHSDEDLWYFI